MRGFFYEVNMSNQEILQACQLLLEVIELDGISHSIKEKAEAKLNKLLDLL